jgi:hypothetical protein
MLASNVSMALVTHEVSGIAIATVKTPRPARDPQLDSITTRYVPGYPRRMPSPARRIFVPFMGR